MILVFQNCQLNYLLSQANFVDVLMPLSFGSIIITSTSDSSFILSES